MIYVIILLVLYVSSWGVVLAKHGEPKGKNITFSPILSCLHWSYGYFTKVVYLTYSFQINSN